MFSARCLIREGVVVREWFREIPKIEIRLETLRSSSSSVSVSLLSLSSSTAFPGGVGDRFGGRLKEELSTVAAWYAHDIPDDGGTTAFPAGSSLFDFSSTFTVTSSGFFSDSTTAALKPCRVELRKRSNSPRSITPSLFSSRLSNSILAWLIIA